MKRCLLLLLLPAVAGCFTVTPPPVANWTVNGVPGQVTTLPSKYGIARLSQVSVRSPYESASLALVRPDGSLAFDPYNRFAAAPAGLLKGATLDILRKSGLFKDVISSTSAARSSLAVEVDVTKLAIEPVGEGLQSKVRLEVTVIDQRERTVVAFGEAYAAAEVGEFRFTEAFSQAYTEALCAALGKL